ncbi:MAG TPA: GNAT family N-acetyltransferase [Jatrophihabitans sp.]|nr:GNAT family N-acetyltransferase [Jatrophihabitans sp.]
MTTEIRTVPVEDMLGWLRSMRTGLLADPGNIDEPQLDRWRATWEPDRTFGAYADGRCVGTLRTFGTLLSVPAGPGCTAQLPADALTQVSVAGTHRRQGLLRGMLTRSLADARERGEVFSYLRAAEWQIYGRFGYQPASFAANYRINTGNPLLTVRPGREPVEIRHAEPADARAEAPQVLDRIRQQQAGHIERTKRMWDWKFGLHPAPGTREPICVLARTAAGRVDGYALWTPNDGNWFHESDQQAQAAVHEVLAATEDAERALWNYLIHLDLVRVLTLTEYPVDLPLEWLVSDGRTVRRTWIGDDTWLRILDLPAALRTRRYAVADRLVLQVIDDEGGYAQGRFLLDAGPEHAECRPSTESADLQLSQRALAGIYLGGSTVRAQRLAGLLEEETPGAADRLQLMFATERAPWNASPF